MVNVTLRDYQKKIVDELKYLKTSALFMGTGTGKTFTSLEIVKYHPTKHLIVICPHSAIGQWKMVIQSHYKEYSVVDYPMSWSSLKIDEHLRTIDKTPRLAFIINYDKLPLMPSIARTINKHWTLIVDEMHRIKNIGTRRNPVKTTSAVLKIGRNVEYKIGLTATPTQGNFGAYIDYYSQLRLLDYIDLDYKAFYDRYVLYKEVTYGTTPFPIKEITGYQNTNELDNLLKIVAKRYVAKYKDFEPQFNKILLDKPKSYNKLVREKAYKKDDKVILLNNTARSRIAKKTLTTGRIMGYNMNAVKSVIEDNTIKKDWLRDFLQDTDEVVSVFYTYNVELESLKELCEKLGKKYIVINGNTKDKYTLVNNGGYEVVLGQFQAMSEALDGLHRFCHIEVFYSMPESSLHYMQAIGRIDRIGQEKVPMYYFLIMSKTIDEHIMFNIEHKIEFSERTLEQLEV